MHVLVVDDEPDIRLILQINLERWGHVVSTAADAEEALAICRSDAPHAMLLDLSMPDRDGMSLLDELGRARWPQALVVLSAALPSQVRPIIEQGARFLPKPFGVADLRALIEEIAAEIG